MNKKKIIPAVFIAFVLCVICLVVCNNITSNQKYDYKYFTEIPSGYVDCDEKENAGKDYDYIGWYKYNELPELISDYKLVEGNDKMVKRALEPFASYGDFANLTELVSDDDYFILTSYSHNEGEIYDENEMFNEVHYKLYFFDTQSLTLYKIEVIW